MSPSLQGYRAVARGLALASAATLVMACGPSESERRLDTIDVRPPPEIDISSDPQEVRRAPSLSGVLPSDFPDFPLHLPATIVDLGTAPGGRRTVTLHSLDAPARTLAALRTTARATGWQLVGSEVGAGGAEVDRWSKGGHELVVAVTPERPGTAYRIEY